MADSKALRALRELADVLAKDHPDVRQRVTLAVEDPPAYVKKFAKELHERAIDAPKPNLALVALIDGLAKHKLLAEIDSGSSAEDAQWGIDHMPNKPKAKNLWSWTNGLDLEDMDAESFLERAGDELRKHGVALVHLGIGSDAFPLVIVPNAHAPRVVDLATKAGFDSEIVTVTSKKKGSVAEDDDEDDAAAGAPEAHWRAFVRGTERGDDVWCVNTAPLALGFETSRLGEDGTNTDEEEFDKLEGNVCATPRGHRREEESGLSRNPDGQIFGAGCVAGSGGKEEEEVVVVAADAPCAHASMNVPTPITAACDSARTKQARSNASPFGGTRVTPARNNLARTSASPSIAFESSS